MKKLLLVFLVASFCLRAQAQGPYPVNDEVYLSPHPAKLLPPAGTAGSSYEPFYRDLSMAPIQGKIAGLWLDGTDSGWQNFFIGQVVDPDSIAASTGVHIAQSSAAEQRMVVMNNTQVVTINYYNSVLFPSLELWSVADTTVQLLATLQRHEFSGSFNLLRLSDTQFALFQENTGGEDEMTYRIGTITPSHTLDLGEPARVGARDPLVSTVEQIVSFGDYFLVELPDGVHRLTFNPANNEFEISAPISGLSFPLHDRASVALTSGAFASLGISSGQVVMDITAVAGLNAGPVASVTFDLSSDRDELYDFVGVNLGPHTMVWSWTSTDGDTHLLLVGLNDTDDAVIRASHKTVHSPYQSFIRLGDHLAAYNFLAEDANHHPFQNIQLLSDEDIFNVLSVADKSLDFGEVDLGTTVHLPLSITNNGQLPITINDLMVPAGISANWDGGVIQPGSTKNITVSFTPTQAEAYSGTIDIVRDEVFHVPVAVTGKGRLVAAAMEETDDQITVYPNPTSASVTILSAEPVNEYKLYSIEGQLLDRGKNTTVNLNHQKGGLYFLQISAGRRVVTKKVILKD